MTGQTAATTKVLLRLTCLLTWRLPCLCPGNGNAVIDRAAVHYQAGIGSATFEVLREHDAVMSARRIVPARPSMRHCRFERPENPFVRGLGDIEAQEAAGGLREAEGIAGRQNDLGGQRPTRHVGRIDPIGQPAP